MTDPSSDDRDDRPLENGGSNRTDSVGDGTASADEREPDDAVGVDPVGADGPGSESTSGVVDSATSRSGDPLVAVAVAVALGVIGPLIAIAGGLGVFAVDAVVELGLVGQLLLTLFVGQYVAFAGLAVAYLAWRGFDRDGIVSYLGIRWPSLRELGLVVVGWVVIIVSVMGISMIVQLLGAETAANQSAELAIDNPAIIPLFIAASFLVIGPCEEILYRGVVQGRLRESLPAAPAIVIASAVFAFIHVMALTGGVTGRLTTVAILFFPSLVFGVVYEYTENIVVPSLLHGLHNAVIFTLLYVTVTYADELEQLAEGGALVVPL